MHTKSLSIVDIKSNDSGKWDRKSCWASCLKLYIFIETSDNIMFELPTAQWFFNIELVNFENLISKLHVKCGFMNKS